MVYAPLDAGRQAQELKESKLLIAKLQERITKLQEEFLKLEHDSKETVQNLSKLEAANVELVAKNTELQQKVSKLELLSKTTEGNKKNDNKLEHVVNELAEKQKEYTKLQEANKNLQSSAADLQRAKEKVEKELQLATSKLEQELQNQDKGQVSILQNVNKELAATVDELKTRILELEKQSRPVSTRPTRSYSVHRQDKFTGEIKTRTVGGEVPLQLGDTSPRDTPLSPERKTRLQLGDTPPEKARPERPQLQVQSKNDKLSVGGALSMGTSNNQPRKLTRTYLLYNATLALLVSFSISYSYFYLVSVLRFQLIFSTVSVHTLRKNRALSMELQKRLSQQVGTLTFAQDSDSELDAELLFYTKVKRPTSEAFFFCVLIHLCRTVWQTFYFQNQLNLRMFMP